VTGLQTCALPIFVTSVTPPDSLYVQSQLLYTEKLYYRFEHDNAALSELKVTDARVQPLGDVRQYTTVIDGKRLGVYERRFLIFPAVSGELVIPGQRFTARMLNAYDRWSRGQQVSVVRSEDHTSELQSRVNIL